MSAREFLFNVTIILTVMAIGAVLEILLPMFVDKPWRRERRMANLGTNRTCRSHRTGCSHRSRPHGGAELEASWTTGRPRPAVLGGSPHRHSRARFLGRLPLAPHDAHVAGHVAIPPNPPQRSVRGRDDDISHTPSGNGVAFSVRNRADLAARASGRGAAHPALLQATNGVIEHANIRLWPRLDRVLSLIWVTPNVHKIHHSRQVSETNSNYANLLTVYDRLFGTYTPPGARRPCDMGWTTPRRWGVRRFRGC